MSTGMELFGQALFEWVKNKTTEGDRELTRGRARTALACYAASADPLRKMLDELERRDPNQWKGVPIHFSLMVVTDYLSVVLSRIAEAYHVDGKLLLEREAWEEMAVRLERVLPHAGGDTKDRFLSRLDDARGHLNT
jgi:hypothetical protein